MVLCISPLDGVRCLTRWLRGLGVLGIFWAKRIRRIEVVSLRPLLLALEWQRSRRAKRAILALCYEAGPDCLGHLHGLAGDDRVDPLLITASQLPQGLYDKWSKVFIYDVNGSFLEPNWEIIVELYEPSSVDDTVTLAAETVQTSSWGFYKSPPRRDYMIIARLSNGEPVGSAYYNPVSSNVDYGIHVAKPYWRRRIGTRFLVEVARLAKSLGHQWISVVRVIRGTRPALADRRAIAFYQANKPRQELNIYRLATS